MASSSSVHRFKETNEIKDDEENIDSLLDSALDDFEKVKENELKNNNHNVTSREESKDGLQGEMAADPVMNEVYEQLFKEFHNLQSCFQSTQPSASSQSPSSNPSLSQKTALHTSSSNIPDDVSKTLQEALKSLNDLSTSQTSTGGLSDADLAELMAEMGRADETDADNPEHIMPLMKSMMQKLLSKELLYTPLKEISTKYPAWMAGKEGSLSKEEMHRYKQQYSLMLEMVHLYEEEEPNDSQETKDRRFDNLLDLMQKMQQLGNPPKEIAGDFAGFETDDLGLPKGLDGLFPPANQCSPS